MSGPVILSRPYKRVAPARRAAWPSAAAYKVTRHKLPVAQRPASKKQSVTLPQEFGPDPYIDYGRYLTPEGGILITYKDIDERLRHILWGGLAWTVFTGLEAWLLPQVAPTLDGLIGFALLFATAILNWFIVSRPVEVYRKVEIRPDCMIIEGADVFWSRHMENGFPSFRPDDDGNCVLSGIYGSRLVDYLTVRRFDEFDRAPEVFAAHLAHAMNQLWASAPNG